MTTVTVKIGTRFDDITIEVRRDYVRRDLGERLHHIFRIADGRTLPCAGPGWCRECNIAMRALGREVPEALR